MGVTNIFLMSGFAFNLTVSLSFASAVIRIMWLLYIFDNTSFSFIIFNNSNPESVIYIYG